MNGVGKVKIVEVLGTTGKARHIHFEDGRKLWMPESTIRSFDPNSKIMHFDLWILKQKSIKYKLK